MTNQEINIAIAEACGWKGVPVQQIWMPSKRGKYWRSTTPVEILDEISTEPFGVSMIARWLQKPDGKPLIILKHPAEVINGYTTYRDRPVVQHFNEDEWPQYRNVWEFQTNEWPMVLPSLVPFVKYLPDYCNDLNAINEAVMSLSNTKFNKWSQELSLMITGTKHKAPTREFLCAAARQRAEAFLKTLNLWKS